MKKSVFVNAVALSIIFGAQATLAVTLSKEERLGKIMFQDKDFSYNLTQSCQTCHHHTAGFADPTNNRDPYYTIVSLGADGISKGGRNAPSAAYAGYSPPLVYDTVSGEWRGGMFWDGRADGTVTGDPLADQAQGPPLNPAEMNMTDEEAVVQAVRDASYAPLFYQVYGDGSLDDVDTAYKLIATAIAKYERSVEVQKFSSRFDRGELSESELRGKSLFVDKCSVCHVMDDVEQKGPVFTNYGYANIGIPKNPLLPSEVPDLGLGTTVGEVQQYGKFKIPTLRNVGISAPYGHNGYFPTLKDIVNFKNSRESGSWPEPEVADNLTSEIGNLEMSDENVNDLVAFLMSLTDQ